ncbi:MAG TPA: MFS transporter, partial [Thermoleophilaceae bacterium]
TSFNAALVIGPALAGTIAGVVGAQWSLATEAVLALAALVLIVCLPGLDQPPRGGERSLLGVAAEGLKQVAVVPELRGITAAGAIGLGGLGLLTIAFPLFCVEHLGVERSAAGYLWAAFAVGSTIGALSLVRLQQRFSAERVVLTGYVAFGMLMLLWPLAGSLSVALVLVALAALVDGPVLAGQFAVRQQRVPQRLHAQVFTTAAGLKVGAFSLGTALGGAVVVSIGSATAIAIAAAVQFVAAAAGLALSRWPRPAVAQSSS